MYVGSTCQPLSKIMHEHKSKSRCNKNCGDNKFYQAMREIGLDKCYIELIETYPCKSKEELRAREGHYIREKDTLNQKVAGRSLKYWVDSNNEYLKYYKTTIL